MGVVLEAKPVKFFCGVLAGEEHAAVARRLLSERYGPLELASELWPFEESEYYRAEMGPGLKRQFVALKGLADPGQLAAVKLETNAIEKEHDNSGRRVFNLDPGYLSEAKVVLASTKDYAHRLYLGGGIYGEVTLSYRGGEYVPLEHTYPDYRSEHYRGYFKRLRELYVAAKREREL